MAKCRYCHHPWVPKYGQKHHVILDQRCPSSGCLCGTPELLRFQYIGELVEKLVTNNPLGYSEIEEALHVYDSTTLRDLNHAIWYFVGMGLLDFDDHYRLIIGDGTDPDDRW